MRGGCSPDKMCLMFTPAAHPSTCVREAACHKACTSMCSILLVCVCVCIVMDESARAPASPQRGKQKALAALRLLLHPTKCKCAEKTRGGYWQEEGRKRTKQSRTAANHKADDHCSLHCPAHAVVAASPSKAPAGHVPTCAPCLPSPESSGLWC